MNHLEEKEGYFQYFLNKVHMIFLIDFFESIRSKATTYKFLISIFITLILILFSMIVYYLSPKSEEIIFFILAVGGWFQILRIILLFFCNNNNDITVFNDAKS